MMRSRAGFWLNVALVLAAAGCLGWLSLQGGFLADWTAHSRASLAPASRDLLSQLDGPVQVTCYASPNSGLRPTVAAFIARYQRHKADLSLQFVDPEQDPKGMREAGIRVDGELVIAWRDYSQHLTTLSEQSFDNVLARLARGGERLVAFVAGDGERNPAGKANADLGQFMATQEKQGLRAVPLNFAQVDQVPQGTNLVVLASPLVPLSKGAVESLMDYVAAGGNLLWLLEPDPRDFGLQPLARALGVHVLPGMLVDGAGAKMGLKDPRNVTVATYPANPVTDGLQLVTLFPQVAPLARVTGDDWRVQPLLRSSAQSWNERSPIDNQNPSTVEYDADQDELKGPLDFGFSLSRLSPEPGKRQQRVVIIGDGDFLSNAFVGNAGNAALGRRIFNWLLGDDELVDLAPRPAPDQRLEISQAGVTALAFGLLIALPLVLLLIAGGITWRRRRR